MRIQNQREVNVEALLVEIVLKRQQMMEIAEQTGFTSCETIRCSQELDGLLNIYQKQLLEEERKLPLFSFLGNHLAFQKS
ncbi:aspartyl-phosphate phosphatase Spo0E family protein [Bacillus sp. CGMCC 1.16541]|uniref:aspartyl-phosphate phosphatase Spo0E family protein n=1 Tax=Bacillus sp. CGMCC 1.16541 TaxID=2185143 RepID=UPI001EF4F25B|nr:aspartyl-phosphate phosphatase Spo0E family protein [Bacillus sp. CGMCC 1.16541]